MLLYEVSSPPPWEMRSTQHPLGLMGENLQGPSGGLGSAASPPGWSRKDGYCWLFIDCKSDFQGKRLGQSHRLMVGGAWTCLLATLEEGSKCKPEGDFPTVPLFNSQSGMTNQAGSSTARKAGEACLKWASWGRSLGLSSCALSAEGLLGKGGEWLLLLLYKARDNWTALYTARLCKIAILLVVGGVWSSGGVDSTWAGLGPVSALCSSNAFCISAVLISTAINSGLKQLIPLVCFSHSPCKMIFFPGLLWL